MKIIDIELKTRDKEDNLNIPAVIYGKGINKSYPCMVNKKEFSSIVKTNTRNIILNCKIEGGKQFPSLIKEIQKDVISFEPIHVDFFTISLKEDIKMNIPVVPIGEPKGVKSGGISEQVIFSVDIQGKPTAIPEKLIIEISNLEIGDTIHLSEVEISKDIVLLTPIETALFTVLAPRVEEVVAPTAAATAAAAATTATPATGTAAATPASTPVAETKEPMVSKKTEKTGKISRKEHKEHK
jgi:large subunit ribosomal protein L25